MSAERYPTILPDLSYEESIECSKIYSVKGAFLREKLISRRPFRSPHHSASYTSIIGGGSKPLPGEISLAHNGVLFLDEIAEFSKKAIEQLREPLENGHLTLSRAKMSVDYPADFILIAAMNPCPCGYYMDPNKECTCSQSQINRYLSKLSNPILDRIDIHIEVYPARYEDLVDKRKSMSSAEMKDKVLGARKVQEMRQGKILNAKLTGKNLKDFCKLSEDSEVFLEGVYRKLALSARSYTKILKVARTIADIEGRKEIAKKDLLEAIQYRKKFQEK